MLKRKTDPKTVKHTLCEPAQSKCTRTCQKRHFAQKFAGPISRGQRFVRACAVEMHMDMSEEAFCVEIYRENSGPVSRPAFCASLRSRNAHGHVTRGILSGNLQVAQSKCIWTCQEMLFFGRFTGKMPNAPDTTSMENQALTVTARTPQCGHIVWGTEEKL